MEFWGHIFFFIYLVDRIPLGWSLSLGVPVAQVGAGVQGVDDGQLRQGGTLAECVTTALSSENISGANAQNKEPRGERSHTFSRLRVESLCDVLQNVHLCSFKVACYKFRVIMIMPRCKFHSWHQEQSNSAKIVILQLNFRLFQVLPLRRRHRRSDVLPREVPLLLRPRRHQPLLV